MKKKKKKKKKKTKHPANLPRASERYVIVSSAKSTCLSLYNTEQLP